MDKLAKIKKLADAMYYAAQYLTTDASRLRKTMEDYHQFIIQEWHKEEPVSGLDNGDMPIERWKQAVKAASNQRSYRSSKGLTETRDDYFVDGVQWADEHPKEVPVSEDLEEAIGQSFIYHENRGDDFRSDKQIETAYRYGFETGAKWQKEQMIKGAVEGKVDEDYYIKISDETWIDLDPSMQNKPAFGLKKGDKVKILIQKE